MKKVLVLTAFAVLMAGGCSGPDPNGEPVRAEDELDADDVDEVPDEVPDDLGDDLVDNRQVYEQDGLEPLTLRIEIDDLAQLQYVLGHPHDREAEVAALVQDDTFAQAATAPNATLGLRGKSTRGATQKSFKIKLLDKSNPWRGHTTIHLNKHIYDHTRIRNKLSFDLFATIPHLTSLRTLFVHLFINGEDQGLFTQIEDAKKTFLTTHGLDPNGTLYKANRFGFSPIKVDVARDPVAFNILLEKKANPDPEKILEMIDAVNDRSRDIDDVIDEHFSRDNYLAWLASNVLMANTDTTSQNFYLYSPSDSRRWYFLPWDYDCAWGGLQQPGEPPAPRTTQGVANWWSPVIHNRFLKKDENVAQLDHRIRELYASQLSQEKVVERLEGYRDIVREFISRPPDLPVLRRAMQAADTAQVLEGWGAEFDRVGEFVNHSYDAYVEALQWPMPIWLGTPKQDGDELSFEWDKSYHLRHHGLSYDFELAQTPEFAPDDVIERQKGLRETWLRTSAPAPGIYYYRIIIRDDVYPEKHWQYSMDVFEDPENTTMHYGVRQVVVW